MKTRNISILLAAAAVAVACSDNSDSPSVVPTPGVDVEFGATLDQSDASTRTYYDNEVTATDGNKSVFPILWQAGDIVRIISPECKSTFQDRNYQVDSDHEGKNYADELNKTTDTGLRWGDEATASFYSIYPASGVTATDISNKTFTLTMPAEQTDTVRTVDGTKVIGTTTYTCRPQMDGCFMYARTPDVPANTTVNLRYKPLSTAIRFTLTGPTSTQSVTIQKVTLHAPEGTYIAGKFTVDLSGDGTPSVNVDESNASNEVVLTAIHENTTNAYLTLEPKETVELNAFIIPQENVSIGDGWYIEVQYNNGDKYQLSLSGTATSGKTMTLTAGMIHRLPDFPNLKDPSGWDPDNWMTNVARNVYLSELSIPGSWNTLNSDFQGTDEGDTDIDSQWSLGCRAFHFDTRWRTNNSPLGLGNDFLFESRITVDALAVADKSDTYNFGTSGLVNDAPKVMRPATTSFVDRLREIVSQIKNNPEEYAVLLCTFAQGSYPEDDEDSDDDNGRSPKYGTMQGKTWMQAISEACDDNSVKDYIYDASSVTSETVVGDVLGKVIVIVCCDYAIPDLTLPTSSKCLFTYAPQTFTESRYIKDGNAVEYDKDVLYKSTTASGTTGLTLYNTYAQATAIATATTGYDTKSRGYAPALTQRETQAGNILAWSKDNFAKEKYDHSDWIFLGLGGYMMEEGGIDAVSGSYLTVASNLNEWLRGKVEDMDTDKSYYPVGLVLMNFVPDYTDLVKEIYQLNTKYQMSHDPNKSSTSGTSSSAKARK